MKDFLKCISENFVLSSAFKFIVYKNEDCNYNPYHNIEHLFNVSKYSYLIGISEGLSNSDLVVLVLSSLFHDAGHLGGTIGKVQDSINIEKSIDLFDAFNNEFCKVENKNLVYKLICCTEYPYTKSNKNCSLLEKIIRDADMSSILETNFIFTTIFGLAKEFYIDVKKQIDNQLIFIDKLEFNTNYCKNLFNEVKLSKIEELNYFKNIFHE